MRRFATSSRMVANEEVRNKFQYDGERGGSLQVPRWWRMRRFALSSRMVANEEVRNKFQDGGE